ARGGGRDAELLPQRPGRGRVADPRSVVDIVRADEAGDLLGGVVDLVRYPAAGEVEADPVGRPAVGALGRAHLPGDQIEGVTPRDPPEARLARATDHRIRQATEITKLRPRAIAKRPDIGKDPRIEGAHRADLEQVEAASAQVDAVDRPVREASDT